MKCILIAVALLGLISLVPAREPSWVMNLKNSTAQGMDHGGTKGLKAAAELTGDQEVPPVDTDAEGEFEIEFDCALTEAAFELEVEADDVVAAHLHCGSVGENGPVIVHLFGMIPGGFDVDGELAAFTITQANLDAVNADCMAAIGYQIETIEDLADAIDDGDVYVNVHTVAFPGGEVRGQVDWNGRPSRCGNGNGNNNDNDDDGDDDDDENENENNNDNDNGHDHGP